MLESILKSTLEFCNSHGENLVLIGMGAYVTSFMLREGYELFKEASQKVREQEGKERGDIIMRVYRNGRLAKTIYDRKAI